MKRIKLFYLKNQLLVANAIANFIGVFWVNRLLTFTADVEVRAKIWENALPFWVDSLFDPFAFSFIGVMTVLYERPFRRYLNRSFRGESITEDLRFDARRRLLNEPFVLIALDLSMWLLAAIVYPFLHWAYDSGAQLIQSSLYYCLSTGLVTATVAFFILEHLLQKRLVPHFFPEGGLSAIPKTLRTRIRTRLVALLFACNLIPLFSMIMILHIISGSHREPAVALEMLRSAILVNALLFIGVGIYLTVLVSRNLSIPFQGIIRTLREIRNGNFDKRVQVMSNDEIGYTGDTINEMIKGLIEREKIQQALDLAREIQQNLLPRGTLQIEGVDIAGKSVYCDETGGDYYDFMPIGRGGDKKIGIVIGDVSGHGISSALLMSSVRASLRQRAFLPGSTADIISDVNHQLVTDIEDSGQFMTMFFMALDIESKHIDWVRAGHDPAILYNLESDSFDELGGPGIALGVDGNWNFNAHEKEGFPGGLIIFLGTDGVWEVRNRSGEMLGKEPIRETIRKNSSSSAERILEAIFTTLDDFIGRARIEDDITSVVVKINPF
ncbi:MAG: SpoIIE family protein phosphatase [Desulfobacterales bacterium]